MGHIKALTMGVALAVAPQFARAADMLPPPMEPPMLRGTVVEEVSGWYLRGDVGVSVSASTSSSKFTCPCAVVPEFRKDTESFSTTAFVSLGVGYQFSSWFRADLQAILRTSSAFHAVESYNQGAFFTNVNGGVVGSGATEARGFDNYNSSIRSTAFMANGYFDIGHWHGLTPFIGAGVGVAVHNVSGLHDIGGVVPFQIWNAAGNAFTIGYGPGGFGWANAKTSMAPAYALMAGVSWDVNKRLKLEMGYKYLNLGTATSAPIVCQPAPGCPLEVHKYKVASHDVHIGMRWMFDAMASASSSYEVSGGYAGGGGYATSGGYAAAPAHGGYVTAAAGGGYAGGGYVAAPAQGGYGSGGYVAGGAMAGGGYSAGAAPHPRRMRRPARVHQLQSAGPRPGSHNPDFVAPQ